MQQRWTTRRNAWTDNIAVAEAEQTSTTCYDIYLMTRPRHRARGAWRELFPWPLRPPNDSQTTEAVDARSAAFQRREIRCPCPSAVSLFCYALRTCDLTHQSTRPPHQATPTSNQFLFTPPTLPRVMFGLK